MQTLDDLKRICASISVERGEFIPYVPPRSHFIITKSWWKPMAKKTRRRRSVATSPVNTINAAGANSTADIHAPMAQALTREAQARKIRIPRFPISCVTETQYSDGTSIRTEETYHVPREIETY